MLGGNSSSEIRVWIVGGTAHGAQKFARETGIMGELFLENQWRNPEGNPILWDHVLLDFVRAEENITLFLNTDVRDVQADGPEHDRTIRSLTGWQMGSEKLIRFEAPMFIDCTGDGLVGFLAGARYMIGREDRSVHGEPWAPEVADDDTLGSTILFYTKDAGAPVRFVPPGIAKDIVAAGIPIRRHIDTSMNGCDFWWIEWGGELDAVEDNEAIRDELWGIVFGIWNHIKNSGEFDAENLTLEWVGTIPGKREYRRFIGDHVRTQQDILDQTDFADVVGFGGWSIDLHPPGGVYSDTAGSKHLYGPGLYGIPFRSLYSINVSNMLMAGRDISASHVAFGTTRVMATCAVTGEAAGTGAALAVRHRVTPRKLLEEHGRELHATLLRQDASILGVSWRDEQDLAFTATVSASSTLTDLATADDGDVAMAAALSLAEVDFALLLPVDPRLDVVRIDLEASSTTVARIELWSTGNGMTHIPVDPISAQEVTLSSGRATLTVPLDHAPDRPGNAVLVIRRNPELAVLISDTRAPYGVLGLLGREPGLEMGAPQTNAWSAVELRRRTPRFATEPASEAYGVHNIVGGLARPFNGPNLWASAPMSDSSQEWVELRWDEPQSVGRIELIFNDDVDEDLVNLHHHRTESLVMPELVRDYRIEVEQDGAWIVIDSVVGNRVRRRVLSLPAALTTSAVRVVITATNGDAHAMIIAMRVFAD